MKWFLGIVILLAGALVLESGLLAYAMYVLLGVLLFSRFLTNSWIGNVTAVRQGHSNAIEIGTVLPVSIKIHNFGFWLIAWLLMEDLLPAKWLTGARLRLAVKKRRIKIVALWESMDLQYEIHFKMRGYYQIGPLVLETGDLFGLHRRHRVATPAEYVLVYPRILPLEGYEIPSRRPLGEIRLTHRFFEDPTRIAGIRAYEPGDPMHRINWKVTAHTGALHTKVLEPSTMSGATLVLDFHHAGYESEQEPQRSELAVTGVASLAHILYLMGEPVGLVSNARDAADRIRTQGFKYDFRTRQEARQTGLEENPNDRLQPLAIETQPGPEQFERIRTMLARVELNDGLTLPQLLSLSGRFLPRNASVIFFLPTVTPEIALALGHLRRRGYQIMALLVAMEEIVRGRSQSLLAAERVPFRHFQNDRELTMICKMAMIR
jgi:uncharacterized protein (DUF58 family)